MKFQKKFYQQGKSSHPVKGSSNHSNKHKHSNSQQNNQQESRSEAKNQSKEVGNSSKANRWNFVVDYNDHFETPPQAYEDLTRVFLDPYLESVGKTRETLAIYDPYYCQGNMIQSFAKLSFTNVINRNQDFYEDIRRKRLPEYDILVTNPPYSGEHKVKLLEFLSTSSHQNRPFALLLPVYVITKSYWKAFLTRNLSSSSSNNSVLYLLPAEYYEYHHPENTGKDIPPFYSIWLVGNLSSSLAERITQISRSTPSNPSRSPSTHTVRSNNPQLPAIPFQTLRVVSTIEEISRLKLVTEKRPNPKQRKKMKARNNH